MVIVFQILMFFVILVSLLMIGAGNDKNLRANATGMGIAAMISFLASVILL